MTLGAPLGLLTLLAVPALIAAYFLRRRQPPRTVSALFLWKPADQRAEAGPRLSRLSREASLALELLAVLFAALFLVDLRCGPDAPTQHLVVVVDGSLSMRAKTGGQSAADRAKTLVASLAQSHHAGALTVVESGLRPTVLAGPQQETTRALSALERWQPAQPAHDFSPALTLARELAGGSALQLLFITDGPLPEAFALPAGVEVRSVGQAAPNLAFLSAQRHDEAGVAQVTVRVGNLSEASREVEVRFVPSDAAPQTHALTLPAGGAGVLRAGFRSSQPIEVLLPEDALEEDGHLTLLPSPVAEVSVALLEGLDEQAKAAVTRFMKVAPGVKFASPALLTVGPPGSTARLQVGAKPPLASFVGPFFAQKGSPLLDDAQLGGVVWTAGENPPGRVLMSAGSVVLMSEEPDGTVHWNVELSRSNVQRTAAWPVLLANVVRQARLSAEGFPRKHLMLGEEVPLVATPGVKWELRSPGGEQRPVIGSGALSLPAFAQPGRWALLKRGEPFDELVVLALDPRESDLRDRGPVPEAPPAPQTLAALATTHPRPWWPLLAVLALVLLDLWLTAAPRRKEVPA